MRTHFEINMPAIPGRVIKFKIQDIKATAFGSQRNRFNDNKSLLTKKFVDSFSNFSEKEPQAPSETTADSRATCFSRDLNFRIIVSEERKHLLMQYNRVKHLEVPITNQSKFDGGFTFYKTGLATAKTPIKSSQQLIGSLLTENVGNEELNREDVVVGRPNKHSSVFRNQTRQRVYSRLNKVKDGPGPGSYYNPSERRPLRKRGVSQTAPSFDERNLRQIITRVVQGQQKEERSEEEVKVGVRKEDHMFVMDDRDRFGDQRYPIASRSCVPGPGQYEVGGGIQEKTKKVLVVEEQRKLLKEWFNS